jgi:hypothetical protein
VPCFLCERAKLAQQSTLPDAGFAGYQHETALIERGEEHVHLRTATDEDGANIHDGILTAMRCSTW